MNVPVPLSVTPSKPVQPPVIVRRAGFADLEAVCDQVAALAEASSTAARWSEVAYHSYLATDVSGNSIQTKALFLAWAGAEPVASSQMSCPTTPAAGQRVVGFAAFSAIPGMGECALENMVVAESWRKQGIGARLLSAGMLWCRTYSASPMWLEVRASNHDAIALYERAGFSIAGRRPHYYREPVEAAIQMKKILQPAS